MSNTAILPGVPPNEIVFGHTASPSAGEPILSVRDAGKIYHIYNKPADRLRQAWWGSRKKFFREFSALRGVSFEMRPGVAWGIIGRNGSGKSTLLQIIAGTLQPSAGQVRVRG